MNSQLQDEYELQSKLSQQNANAQLAASAPYYTLNPEYREAQAALIEQTNPIRILDDIEMKLRGREKTPDGMVRKIGEPIMNEKGICAIRLHLSGIINQITIMSNLEDKEIGRIMESVANDVVDDLSINWKEYGIVEKSHLNIIVNICIIPAFMSLKRALRQGERIFLTKSVVESISTQPKPQPKKGGLGILNRFKI